MRPADRVAAGMICSTSPAARIARLQAPAEQVAEAQDGGEHVVEVVRDSAREPSDRLQPETLLQVLLGAPALRQVEHDAG